MGWCLRAIEQKDDSSVPGRELEITFPSLAFCPSTGCDVFKGTQPARAGRKNLKLVIKRLYLIGE